MLKNVPPEITPDLLRSLASMGHGDRLAVVDRNFPAYARYSRVHPLPGLDIPGALRAILTMFPLDTFVNPPVFHMTPDGEPDARFEVHDDAIAVMTEAEGRQINAAGVERTLFYDLAATSYAVVTTTETRPYACFVLTKGVI
jgi:L-fucose mutarotase